MTTITLTDPQKASKAGAWLCNNVGYDNWTLNVPTEAIFTKNPRYEFSFKKEKDAMLFSLKWL